MCTIPTHILVIHKFRIIHFALIFAEIHPVHVTFRLRFQNISSLNRVYTKQYNIC